jgi:uncharacterized protein (TIGR02284 family)
VDNDKVISLLNDLIETLRDGQNGFQEAAENVQGPDLKEFFNRASLERSQAVGELQQLVHALGGDPENTGSTAGALHRAWMDIKGSLTGKDDNSILSEAERGEDSAVNAYEEALKADLPANIKMVIERQFGEIKKIHDLVKQMRDARVGSASTSR